MDSQLLQRRERIEHPGRQRCDLVGTKVASRVVRGANIVEHGLARRVRVYEPLQEMSALVTVSTAQS